MINTNKNSRCEAEIILLLKSSNNGKTHQRFTMNLNSKGHKSKFQVTETGKLNAQIINMGVDLQ